MDKIYIVMDYVEHDLKALMETMKEPFLVGKFSLSPIASSIKLWIARTSLPPSFQIVLEQNVYSLVAIALLVI